MNNEVLTPQEVAEILKIAKTTVYELIKRGELKGYRVGNKVRVDMEDVENYKRRGGKRGGSVPEQYTKILGSEEREDNDIRGYEAIICGQDIIIDILSRHGERKGYRVLRSYEGSYEGLYKLYNNETGVTAVHMWDNETGEYNIPFVKRMVPGIKCLLIHLALRKQGFYVAKGNPKNVKGWSDLLRDDIVFVNREKGSGTRILLDGKLKEMGVHGSSINGYKRECHSHLASASTIARGGGDVALGNEKGAHAVSGIEFIPLQTESYDIVIKKEDIENGKYSFIMDIIESQEYRDEIIGLGGYDIENIGKVTEI